MVVMVLVTVMCGDDGGVLKVVMVMVVKMWVMVVNDSGDNGIY